jgi:hypothetical protein
MCPSEAPINNTAIFSPWWYIPSEASTTQLSARPPCVLPMRQSPPQPSSRHEDAFRARRQQHSHPLAHHVSVRGANTAFLPRRQYDVLDVSAETHFDVFNNWNLSFRPNQLRLSFKISRSSGGFQLDVIMIWFKVHFQTYKIFNNNFSSQLSDEMIFRVDEMSKWTLNFQISKHFHWIQFKIPFFSRRQQEVKKCITFVNFWSQTLQVN